MPMSLRRLSTGFRALIAQGMASFISFQIIGLMGRMHTVPQLADATWLIVGLHSSLAVVLSAFLRLPPWWLLIQAIFVPVVVVAADRKAQGLAYRRVLAFLFGPG